jgi:two-component system chemotaxis response regulator CheY
MRKIIAIIDDSELFRTQIAGLLMSNGYETLSYCTVKEFRDSKGIERADMILLDVDLPGVNGIDFVKEFAGKGKLTTIPLVLISGTTEEGVLREFKPMVEDETILALDFFRKDRFSYDLLFVKIHALFRLRDCVTSKN